MYTTSVNLEKGKKKKNTGKEKKMTSSLRSQITNELTSLQDSKSSILRLIASSRLSAPSRRQSILSDLHKTVEEFRLNAQRTKVLLDQFDRNTPQSDRLSRAELNRFSAALKSLLVELDQTMRAHLESEQADFVQEAEIRRSLVVPSEDDTLTDALLQQLAQTELAEELLAERELGIQQIQQDVVNLRGLFTQVAFHVNQQGAMLEDIEANIEHTFQDTANASHELRTTADAGYGGGRARTRCLLVVLVLVLIVGLLVLIGVHKV